MWPVDVTPVSRRASPRVANGGGDTPRSPSVQGGYRRASLCPPALTGRVRSHALGCAPRSLSGVHRVPESITPPLHLGGTRPAALCALAQAAGRTNVRLPSNVKPARRLLVRRAFANTARLRVAPPAARTRPTGARPLPEQLTNYGGLLGKRRLEVFHFVVLGVSLFQCLAVEAYIAEHPSVPDRARRDVAGVPGTSRPVWAGGGSGRTRTGSIPPQARPARARPDVAAILREAADLARASGESRFASNICWIS